MNERDDAEEQLIASWETNAGPWIEAVRGHKILSRELGTERVIVEAVEAHAPKRVLDVGCGEGWLVRALAERGIEAVGIDGAAALIEAAEQAGGGRYLQLDYAALSPGSLGEHGLFDLAVANFALLGEELLTPLRAIAALLSGERRLLIQTLHPLSAGPPYRDGWRREDFRDFGSAGAWAPMPWYFRTFGSWLETLRAAGLELEAVREPLHPETELPLSLVLEARVS